MPKARSRRDATCGGNGDSAARMIAEDGADYASAKQRLRAGGPRDANLLRTTRRSRKRCAKPGALP